MYTCPFCKLEIQDSVDSLVAHRQPGGVCDRRMSAQLEKKEKE